MVEALEQGICGDVPAAIICSAISDVALIKRICAVPENDPILVAPAAEDGINPTKTGRPVVVKLTLRFVTLTYEVLDVEKAPLLKLKEYGSVDLFD